MMRSRWVVLLIFAGTAGACGSPTIDGSSDEALETSIAEVRSSLSDEMRPAFDSAVTVVAMGGIGVEDLFARALAGGEAGMTGLEGTVRSELDGLTAEEVIAKADSLRLARLEEKYAELEVSIRSHEEDQEQLANVEVSEPQLSVRGRGFFSTARLELTFSNGLDRTLETAQVHAELISPDREVPWVEEDDVYFRFDGGIAPGETRTDIAYLGDRWTRHDAPDDAELRVGLIRVGLPDDTYIGSRRGRLDTPPSPDSLQALEEQIQALRRGR